MDCIHIDAIDTHLLKPGCEFGPGGEMGLRDTPYSPFTSPAPPQWVGKPAVGPEIRPTGLGRQGPGKPVGRISGAGDGNPTHLVWDSGRGPEIRVLQRKRAARRPPVAVLPGSRCGCFGADYWAGGGAWPPSGAGGAASAAGAGSSGAASEAARAPAGGSISTGVSSPTGGYSSRIR